MPKLCECGAPMDIRLRTIMYTQQSSISIQNVPVLSCEQCDRSEVYPAVKDEIKELIHHLQEEGKSTQLYFHERNEFARLLMQATSTSERDLSLEALIEERINQLLDMLLLVRSLHDEDWCKDIERRLTQITNQAIFR